MQNQATLQENIKIGANLALTGNLAFYGTAEKQGLELAIQDVNENEGINGRNLVILAEDNQGDSVAATTAMHKLLEVDNVDVVFSAFTHIAQPISPIAQEAGKILIYQSTVSTMSKENSFVFRDYFDIVDQGKVLAEHVTLQNHKTLAYLGETSEACEQFHDSFLSNKKLKFISDQTVDPSEQDFRTYLLKAKKTKSDAFVFCVWRSEDKVMPQFEELGLIDTPTYHAVAPFLPSANSANEQFSKNKAISTWYGFVEGKSNPQMEQFAKRYNEVYGEELIPDALFAYDGIMFLAHAFKKCNGTNSECVANILQTESYEGLAEPITFGEDRTSNRKTLLIQYGEQGWEEI
ncbi:hypothetical protein COV18_04745 [Candidatus Woesearchaeota archaeon CG10_big_fil_rev_8_21_14_0_10_37_12]|nr:MAG: hypothetical protein COV18_04745 [Candidatus Woesearchaeota archaeon CG10_big_fil_rev_8_21_14_0_10_37_12]